MKRLLLGLFILSLSTCTLAASNMMASIANSSKHGFFVGIQGLYWQPMNADLDYAIVDPIIDYFPNGKTASIDPKYNLGFSINAGYRFANTKNDISLNYTRLHTGNSDSVSGNRIWAKFIHPDTGHRFANYAKGSADFNYDKIDLLGDYQFQPFNHLDVYGATGLRFAKIDTMLKAIYKGNDFEPKGTEAKYNSDFKGIGPRLSANAVYHLPKHFGLIAGLGASLLIGKIDIKASEYDNDPPRTPSINVKKSNNKIVPELDAKLGVNYTHQFANQSSLVIEGGWKVVNYFEVNGRIQFVDNIHQGNYTTIFSNIGFQGPYLGVTYNV